MYDNSYILVNIGDKIDYGQRKNETLSDLIHKTSMSLTDMYFNHSDEQIQLVNQNYTL